MGITIRTVQKQYPRCGGCQQEALACAGITVSVKVEAHGGLSSQGIPMQRDQNVEVRLCASCLKSAHERLLIFEQAEQSAPLPLREDG